MAPVDQLQRQASAPVEDLLTRPASGGRAMLVGFHQLDDVDAARLEEALGAHQIETSWWVDDAPGSIDLVELVADLRDDVHTAVVCRLPDGDRTVVRRVSATLTAAGFAQVPVIAVPDEVWRRDDSGPSHWDDLADATSSALKAMPPDRAPQAAARSIRSGPELAQRLAAGVDVAQVVAVVDVAERSLVADRFGEGADLEALRAVADVMLEMSSPLDEVGVTPTGLPTLVIRDRDDTWVEKRLTRLAHRLARQQVAIGDEKVSITPVIGWTRVSGTTGATELSTVLARAELAAASARSHLDLRPVKWREGLAAAPSSRSSWAGLRKSAEVVAQVMCTWALGIALPFVAFATAGHYGILLDRYTYVAVVALLTVSAALVWGEGLLSLRRSPARPDPGPAPAATAIVAAYLPNESATILESLEIILQTTHPSLTVLLAYNRPTRLPVEDLLEEMARRDPRLTLVLVEGSTSKAQNVNAALAHVQGDYVGVFDADHHPDPSAFERAWSWIGNGYDMVQGRCSVRNGSASWLSRLVSVEFENMYGVSHPGRSRLHGFAVFGGSNGYWRTSLLREIRMRPDMLTEDIDSSIRMVAGGARTAYDPGLVSYELAPTTVRSLWWQRLRWSQGWFQVSRRYAPSIWGSFDLGLRQKAGMTLLLRWRELLPWVGQLVVPVLAYGLWQRGGRVDHLVSADAFLLISLLCLGTVPAQALLSWRNAVPAMRRRARWFVAYLVLGVLFYGEWRNIVARVSHVRELFGNHEWVVTPRTLPAVSPTAQGSERIDDTVADLRPA